ncbi:AroM family protein [Ktedonosporobacter rubrisoli]|uniref:AroM family protein n=1 Tax=Ktedonosporobacter rubrisoli TaxID=2509675 RepID=A0A4P6JYN0_KTERU|nr:AroM family protein [Ktedonosporobacter rubrisoli]QBD80814.1 AroM family protein [Ktedonosporobacter rubrisoli]
MQKIGTITIGQSPRVDIVPELKTWLRADCEIIEKGALDGLSHAEIARLAPHEPQQDVLVTRLADGSSVTITHEAVIPRVQQCIRELEKEVSTILLLCTGTFPAFTTQVPLLIPEHLLYNFVRGIINPAFKLGVLTPSPDQVPHQQQRWQKNVAHVSVAAATPYADIAHVIEAGVALGKQGVDAIVLDCMGYTLEMKQRIRERVDCPVILSRAVLARVAAELA